MLGQIIDCKGERVGCRVVPRQEEYTEVALYMTGIRQAVLLAVLLLYLQLLIRQGPFTIQF